MKTETTVKPNRTIHVHTLEEGESIHDITKGDPSRRVCGPCVVTITEWEDGSMMMGVDRADDVSE